MAQASSLSICALPFPCVPFVPDVLSVPGQPPSRPGISASAFTGYVKDLPAGLTPSEPGFPARKYNLLCFFGPSN